MSIQLIKMSCIYSCRGLVSFFVRYEPRDMSEAACSVSQLNNARLMSQVAEFNAQFPSIG